MITKAEIQKIATLAKIKLTQKEEERHAKTISTVFDYMKILNEVDTENIEPTFEVNELQNIWREDEIKKSSHTVELVEQFPKKYAGMMLVPQVFENSTKE